MAAGDLLELPLAPDGDTPPSETDHIHVWHWPGSSRLSEDQLRELFLHHGRRTPQHVPGVFAFVVHDSASGTALAARDPVGTRPVYFQQTERSLRLSHSLAPFAERNRLAAAVDLRWIAAYLEGLAPETGTTAFLGVRELLPGELLFLDRGRVEVLRWHSFPVPPSELDPSESEGALASYRDAILEAADVGSRPAVVELGISLAARTLLAAATGSRPAYDPNLWGVGFANFDRARDLLLDEARGVNLSGADVVTGWPGQMAAWNDWYRAGAVALGQPAYHSDLMFQALLDTLDGTDRRVLLAGAHDTAFGWGFWPALAPNPPRARARALVGAARGQWHRFRRGQSARQARGDAWAPGPLLNPAVAGELGLHDLAQRDRSEAISPSRTGYTSLSPSGLSRLWRERLVTWSQLGRQQGVEVVFPLFAPEALHALLDIPRTLNEIDGRPGGVARTVLGARTDGTDWVARRWPGVERPKTEAEARANSTARRRYLRENLHPLLAPLLNLDRLRSRIDRDHGPPDVPLPSPEQRARGAVEFAHIEAANHWLEVWGIQ